MRPFRSVIQPPCAANQLATRCANGQRNTDRCCSPQPPSSHCPILLRSAARGQRFDGTEAESCIPRPVPCNVGERGQCDRGVVVAAGPGDSLLDQQPAQLLTGVGRVDGHLLQMCGGRPPPQPAGSPRGRRGGPALRRRKIAPQRRRPEAPQQRRARPRPPGSSRSPRKAVRRAARSRVAARGRPRVRASPWATCL